VQTVMMGSLTTERFVWPEELHVRPTFGVHNVVCSSKAMLRVGEIGYNAGEKDTQAGIRPA
jgi:hypothetical protein